MDNVLHIHNTIQCTHLEHCTVYRCCGNTTSSLISRSHTPHFHTFFCCCYCCSLCVCTLHIYICYVVRYPFTCRLHITCSHIFKCPYTHEYTRVAGTLDFHPSKQFFVTIVYKLIRMSCHGALKTRILTSIKAQMNLHARTHCTELHCTAYSLSVTRTPYFKSLNVILWVRKCKYLVYVREAHTQREREKCRCQTALNENRNMVRPLVADNEWTIFMQWQDSNCAHAC